MSYSPPSIEGHHHHHHHHNRRNSAQQKNVTLHPTVYSNSDDDPTQVTKQEQEMINADGGIILQLPPFLTDIKTKTQAQYITQHLASFLREIDVDSDVLSMLLKGYLSKIQPLNDALLDNDIYELSNPKTIHNNNNNNNNDPTSVMMNSKIEDPNLYPSKRSINLNEMHYAAQQLIQQTNNVLNVIHDEVKNLLKNDFSTSAAFRIFNINSPQDLTEPEALWLERILCALEHGLETTHWVSYIDQSEFGFIAPHLQLYYDHHPHNYGKYRLQCEVVLQDLIDVEEDNNKERQCGGCHPQQNSTSFLRYLQHHKTNNKDMTITIPIILHHKIVQYNGIYGYGFGLQLDPLFVGTDEIQFPANHHLSLVIPHNHNHPTDLGIDSVITNTPPQSATHTTNDDDNGVFSVDKTTIFFNSSQPISKHRLLCTYLDPNDEAHVKLLLAMLSNAVFSHGTQCIGYFNLLVGDLQHVMNPTTQQLMNPNDCQRATIDAIVYQSTHQQQDKQINNVITQVNEHYFAQQPIQIPVCEKQMILPTSSGTVAVVTPKGHNIQPNAVGDIPVITGLPQQKPRRQSLQDIECELMERDTPETRQYKEMTVNPISSNHHAQHQKMQQEHKKQMYSPFANVSTSPVFISPPFMDEDESKEDKHMLFDINTSRRGDLGISSKNDTNNKAYNNNHCPFTNYLSKSQNKQQEQQQALLQNGNNCGIDVTSRISIEDSEDATFRSYDECFLHDDEQVQ